MSPTVSEFHITHHLLSWAPGGGVIMILSDVHFYCGKGRRSQIIIDTVIHLENLGGSGQTPITENPEIVLHI